MTAPRLRAALQALQQGLWVLDDLGPPFRAALLARVQANDALPRVDGSELLGLTMAVYGIEATMPAALQRDRGELLQAAARAEDVAFWSDLATRVAAGARYRPPSERDSELTCACLAWLGERSPDTCAVLERWITRVVPLAGPRFGGGSHPHLFGCVFLDEATFAGTPQQLAVALVHELAHHELFVLNLLDRLVEQGADEHLVHAPLQGRPRPPIGRLHAAHALWRMSQLQAQTGLDAQANRRLLRATADTFSGWELTAFGSALSQLYSETPPPRDGRTTAERDARRPRWPRAPPVEAHHARPPECVRSSVNRHATHGHRRRCWGISGRGALGLQQIGEQTDAADEQR